MSPVKFDDCMGNEGVVFQSSNPLFGVRTDGSIFAQREGANLDEPVQLKLTASGPHTHVWETMVQLAPIDLPSSQQTENEVSFRFYELEHRHTEISCFKFQLSFQSFFFLSHFLQWSGDSNSQESGQNSLGFQRRGERGWSRKK